jgi:hypothetical protein
MIKVSVETPPKENPIIGFIDEDGTLYMPYTDHFGKVGNIILKPGTNSFKLNGNVHPNEILRGTPVKKGDKVTIQF